MSDALNEISLLYDVPIILTVEIGETTLTVEEILELEVGSMIDLDNSVGEPAKIYANNVLIGYGELAIISDSYAVKVTRIDTIEEIINKIN